MPNDDLGTFPMPQQAPTDDTPATPPVNTPTEPEPIIPTSAIDPVNTTPPAVSEEPITPIVNEPVVSEPPIDEEVPEVNNSQLIIDPLEDTSEEPITTPEPSTPVVEPSVSSFEETPEEIPSIPAIETPVQPQENPIAPLPQPELATPIVEEPVAATLPTKTGHSIAPIIIAVLLIIAGIGVAVAAYLSTQTAKLKTQLSEITQTLEKQQTIITPTATPTVFVIPTPTASPTATPSSIIATPSATPTPTLTTSSLLPLKNAAAALKVAIGRSPNAQLILVKVDNATDLTTAVTKYFFREDTTTKKYFYVAITGKGTPEIIDKQIYVTPDDNIPSLNDAVLGNAMGIDLDEAIKIALGQCANQTTCNAAPIKAQYIKTGTGIIWQLSLYTKGLTSTPLMIQLNAMTKAVLYKSPEFANK